MITTSDLAVVVISRLRRACARTDLMGARCRRQMRSLVLRFYLER